MFSRRTIYILGLLQLGLRRVLRGGLRKVQWLLAGARGDGMITIPAYLALLVLSLPGPGRCDGATSVGYCMHGTTVRGTKARR
jgi:hypothetical protein